MKTLEARDRLEKIVIGDLELKVYLMDMLEKYDRIQKIIRQNGIFRNMILMWMQKASAG